MENFVIIGILFGTTFLIFIRLSNGTVGNQENNIPKI